MLGGVINHSFLKLNPQGKSAEISMEEPRTAY